MHKSTLEVAKPREHFVYKLLLSTLCFFAACFVHCEPFKESAAFGRVSVQLHWHFELYFEHRI